MPCHKGKGSRNPTGPRRIALYPTKEGTRSESEGEKREGSIAISLIPGRKEGPESREKRTYLKPVQEEKKEVRSPAALEIEEEGGRKDRKPVLCS